MNSVESIPHKFISNRNQFIISICKDRKILDIGACDAPYTQTKYDQGLLLFDLLSKISEKLVGIDMNAESVQLLKELGFDNIIECSVESLERLEFQPDIIILGETIEHLINFESTFNSVKLKMKKDTKLIITTPNAFYIRNFYKALLNREWCHPDHTCFFSRNTLAQLMQKLGFSVDEIIFSFLPRPHFSFRKFLEIQLSRIFPMFAETIITVVSVGKK